MRTMTLIAATIRITLASTCALGQAGVRAEGWRVPGRSTACERPPRAHLAIRSAAADVGDAALQQQRRVEDVRRGERG